MKIIEQIELKSGLSPNKIWFTSDTHFFNTKVIEYSHRPFASVEEMNEELIARWNSVVHRDGIVFHLGDFCFGNLDKWNYLLDRLKGKIFLVLGNHDVRHINEDIVSRFECVAIQMRIHVNGQKIYLNHFPFLSYSGDNHGTWQLHGHIHTNMQDSNIIDKQRLSMLLPCQYDVGVDNNNFTPVSFRQVEQIMERRHRKI
ncbi:MAG: metallophosphoesterase [Bacteroidales bacterium]|nr:metallophosphoesterase [Bacteroidales bacterium]